MNMTDNSKVVLSEQECFQSGIVGYRRNLESIVNHRTPRFPERYPGELFVYHIFSAMAELAVAKALNAYWSFHENKFSSGDVGDYEVRYSTRNDLKVRERDTGIAISVTGYPPEFEIAGWIRAEDAKQEHWKRDFNNHGKPAYFVPHQSLRPFEELLNGAL